jgi:hypothetical protein
MARETVEPQAVFLTSTRSCTHLGKILLLETPLQSVFSVCPSPGFSFSFEVVVSDPQRETDVFWPE